MDDIIYKLKIGEKENYTELSKSILRLYSLCCNNYKTLADINNSDRFLMLAERIYDKDITENRLLEDMLDNNYFNEKTEIIAKAIALNYLKLNR